MDEHSFLDPFLGDKNFEDYLVRFIEEGPIKSVLDTMYSPESIKTKLADMRRGIRIYMGRTNKESKDKMKEHFLELKTDEDKSIWLFLSMGRCFYD